MKAIKDLIYMFGLWIIGRFYPEGQAELMEKWAKGIRNTERFYKKRRK